jgi:NifB/MoaA-like Fe-S oxidoreductase
LLTIVDRMLTELDVAVHARRQDGRTWASGRQRAHQAAERLRASLRRIDPHRAAPSPPPGDG